MQAPDATRPLKCLAANCCDRFDQVMETTGYGLSSVIAGPGGGRGRIRVENVEELSLQRHVKYDRRSECRSHTLAGFLGGDLSSMTDIDNFDPDADTVVLMTMHSAKGPGVPRTSFWWAWRRASSRATQSHLRPGKPRLRRSAGWCTWASRGPNNPLCSPMRPHGCCLARPTGTALPDFWAKSPLR